MNMPFRRSKSLPERALRMAGASAGLLRLAIRQRTLHPQLVPSKRGHGLRAMHRG
jgi:hypothetical protein